MRNYSAGFVRILRPTIFLRIWIWHIFNDPSRCGLALLPSSIDQDHWHCTHRHYHHHHHHHHHHQSVSVSINYIVSLIVNNQSVLYQLVSLMVNHQSLLVIHHHLPRSDHGLFEWHSRLWDRGSRTLQAAATQDFLLDKSNIVFSGRKPSFCLF